MVEVKLGVVKQHRDWLVSNHYAADSNFAVPLRRVLHLPHRHKGAGFVPRFNGSF